MHFNDLQTGAKLLPSRFERCLFQCGEPVCLLVEREIIFLPKVAILSYKSRQHNHNHPINVFQRVNSFTSSMTSSRKSLIKAEGNRAFYAASGPYIQFCASVGAAGTFRCFGRKLVLGRVLAAFAGLGITSENWCVDYPLRRQTYFPL